MPVATDPHTLIAKPPAGEPVELTLRVLRPEDYAECEALQRHTWGDNFSELVPASMMMINQKLGGVLAGAFDPGGRLVAFIFGQTGPRDGRLFHWSHMLAVRRELRGCGLGRRLKLFQRRLLLDLGVDEVEWTYDPLESRNAHLNLNRLGAEPIGYERDVYGDGSSSGLHSGIGTDRFVVRWRLRDPAVEAKIEGRAPAVDLAFHGAPAVNVDERGAPLAPPFELPDLAALRVEVPSDIQAVKASSVAVAKGWRAATRYAFETCFERGCRVPHLLYDSESHRSFYLVVRR